ncbi:MAG: hypothetical protein ACOY58_01445, partial [Candidatus Micrarchaeota archaeon]
KQKESIRPFLKRWKLYEKVLKVDQVVNVDDYVSGCPMFEQIFLEVLDKYLRLFDIPEPEESGRTGKG